jgi:hypothetical protein
MNKDCTLEGKIIRHLNKRYPKTRINSIERLNNHGTYYAVKCNITELFANGHWNDVSTFFIDTEEIK